MTSLDAAQLRARFALRLAELYGSEVPAYTTLVDVSREVNRNVLAAHGRHAERLGDIDRVSAERHGAIRVGSPDELAQAARVFAGFGMHPVGFYDLRNGGGAGVPVVSTAFRPVEADELARNPFRVFTSMLTVDDERYFDAATRARLREFVGARRLFAPELLALADRAAVGSGLPGPDADRLLELATAAFRLSTEPVDRAWYDHLSAISSVAADIGGVAGTHINHLTPRVLDIEELYQRMRARGVEMIEAIQGPPAGPWPDVLLRQTSFRALDERRTFRLPDGTLTPGTLRVRFGEVEQRGIALTAAGMRLYEQASLDGAWTEAFPDTESELAAGRLGWFTYSAAGPATGATRLSELVAAGTVTAHPVVYEDFLPRSATGIFRSNLEGDGTRADAEVGSHYDIDRLSGIVGTDVLDPQQLYRAQRRCSIDTAARALAITIDDDLDPATGTDPA